MGILHFPILRPILYLQAPARAEYMRGELPWQKYLNTVLQFLDPEYQSKVIDLEECLYRKISPSYDLEISGVSKKGHPISIYVWDITKGTGYSARIVETIHSISLLLYHFTYLTFRSNIYTIFSRLCYNPLIKYKGEKIMKPLFEGLTASEIEYLRYLKDRGYFDGIEMFINLDTSSDYRVQKLLDGEYIIFDGSGPHSGSKKITVTGKGIAALIDYDKYQNQIQPLNKEIKALNLIAESLKSQLLLAEKTAQDSEKDSKLSKRLAIISIIIAILAMLPDLIRFIYDVLKILS